MQDQSHKVKSGDILYNVIDVYGTIHKKARVIDAFINTVTIYDLFLKNTWVVDKTDLHEKVKKTIRYGKDFDLRGNQRHWQQPGNFKKLNSRLNNANNKG